MVGIVQNLFPILKKKPEYTDKQKIEYAEKIYYWMDEEEISRLTKDVSEELMGNIEIQLVKQDINFEGDLRRSMTLVDRGAFKDIELRSIYAKFVEFGFPAGIKVNTDALEKWIKGKMLLKNKKSMKKLNDPKEVRRIMFAVQGKIFKEGIKPKKFMKKAILRLKKKNKVVAERTSKLKSKPIQKPPTFIQKLFPILRGRTY